MRIDIRRFLLIGVFSLVCFCSSAQILTDDQNSPDSTYPFYTCKGDVEYYTYSGGTSDRIAFNVLLRGQQLVGFLSIKIIKF
jgi:hypothetical protein